MAGQQSKAVGYEKKMGVRRVPALLVELGEMCGGRCDSAHRRTLDAAGETPDEAEAACSADPNCGGLYDQGCNNWLPGSGIELCRVVGASCGGW